MVKRFLFFVHVISAALSRLFFAIALRVNEQMEVIAMKNVTKRKSQFRIRELLPNGEYLNMYCFREKGCTCSKCTSQDPFQWHIALYVSKSRKLSSYPLV